MRARPAGHGLLLAAVLAHAAGTGWAQPPAEASIEAVCPAVAGGPGGVVVAGAVRDSASGIPLPGARVRIAPSGDGERARTAFTDGDGHYVLCDVSAGGEVLATAAFLDRRARARFRVPARRFVVLDFRLTGGAPLRGTDLDSTLEIRRRATDGPLAEVAGVVVDDRTGEPIPGAQVALAPEGRGAVVDLEGGFRIADVPPGPYRLEILRLGYLPVGGPIDIAAGDRLRIDARLVPTTIRMDPVTAEVTPAGNPLEAPGVGHAAYRLTADDIPDDTPLNLMELVGRSLPGLRYVRSGVASGLGSGCPRLLTRNGAIDRVVLDGQTFDDTCVLHMVEPADVADLSVVISYAGQTAFGEPGGGVIVITTRRALE